MRFEIVMLIAIFLSTICVASGVVVGSLMKSKTNKKSPLCICCILCGTGLIIYISFLISITNVKHLDSKTDYKEYPIEKVTLKYIYFNNRGGDSFDESYIVLEKPDNKYQNIVIEETENYDVKWLFFKFKNSTTKYHVYLSNDVYERLKNGDIIYKSEIK